MEILGQWLEITEANDFLYKLGTGIFHAAVEVELMALNQNQK